MVTFRSPSSRVFGNEPKDPVEPSLLVVEIAAKAPDAGQLQREVEVLVLEQLLALVVGQHAEEQLFGGFGLE